MACRRLIRSDVFPYHVFNRCNNREPFQLSLELMWELTLRELYRVSIVYGARPHAFTLMPNHYHLLISTPQHDLGKVMGEFGKSVTRSYNRLTGRVGHLFQGKYGSSIIRSPTYYACALKYVYRNPVRAGLCQVVEQYRFSTLHGLVGEAPLALPLYYPRPEMESISFLPHEMGSLLEWINQPFRNELQAAISLGLKRDQFEIPEGMI